MKNFMNIYQEILCIIAFRKKADDKACVCFFYKKNAMNFIVYIVLVRYDVGQTFFWYKISKKIIFLK
jgi:hypothetical protein